MSHDRVIVKLVFASLALISVTWAYVEDLRCEEIENNDYSVVDQNYCTVQNLEISHDAQVNCDVYPQTRDQVRVVKFYSSRMLFIPFGIFRYFQEIRDFDISDSSVIDIPRHTFEGAHRLLYLSVSHNNLTELGPSVFVGAAAMYLLNVSHNHIANIDRNAFTGLDSISRLDLSYNRLSTLDAALFNDLNFMDIIYLNDNRLHTIDSKQFQYNTQLRSIVLDNNQLYTLNTSNFDHMTMLESLQVSGNFLKELNTTSFPQRFRILFINNNNLTELTVSNLDDLQASNNRIRKLRIQTPDQLKRLFVANNSLTNIDFLSSLTNLEILDISANCVHNSISTFAKLKLLTRLNLARTCLAELNFGIFSSQRSLRDLDISYNNLTEVHLDLFAPYLNQLESIFLDGNKLTEIGGIFQMNISAVFPTLTTVGMSNNPFNCTYLTQLFRLFNTLHIKLPVDPDLSYVNTTHVFGIACTNDKASSPTIFPSPSSSDTSHGHFLALHHPSLVAQVERIKLDAILGQQEIELRSQRLKLEQSQLHEQMLLTNLMTMKVVIGIACAVGLIVLAMKCVTFYRRNRDFMVLPTMMNGNGNGTSVFRSTTTMNTLQSSLEPGV